MSIADSFLQGLQAPLQVPQAGLPMDMTPYVTALPDLKQHEQRVKEQARMQKYIDDMAAKIKKENLDAQDELSFVEGGEKMAFVSSNPWIRRKWLEKVANPPQQVMSLPDEPQQSVPESSSGQLQASTNNQPLMSNQQLLSSQDAFEQSNQEYAEEARLRRGKRDTLLKDMYGPVSPDDKLPPEVRYYSRAIATKPRELFTDPKADASGTAMEKYVKQYGQSLNNGQPMTPKDRAALDNKMMLGGILETIADPNQDPTAGQIAYLEKAKADQEKQRREIDLRNRFMEGRVNDADIGEYRNLLVAEKTRNDGLTVPSNQQLTDRARRNRQQYQRRIKNTLDRAANTGAYKTVGNYSILPGTTEVTNSPQDLAAIKSRAERLKGQNVVGFRDTGAQFFKHTRDSKLDPNPQQFPKLTSDKERQRRELINDRLNLLKPRNNGGDRVFSNDTQRLKNQISSYKPQPQEQSYSEYFSGLGNRLANLGTRLVRPVTTGAQQLASYALDQNILGLADYVDDDQERLLNASLYHSTGDRDYLGRIQATRDRAIEAAQPEGYSEGAYDTLLSQVRQDRRSQTDATLRNAMNTPRRLSTPVSVARNIPLAAQQVLERDPFVINRQKQLEQFENFRRFRDAQREAQADYDNKLQEENFFTDQLVSTQLRPFMDTYREDQQGYFDDAKDSITRAVKNYYGFGRDGGNPPLKEEYSLEGLKSPFRAARQEISDLYANPRGYLREVALGLDKNNPLAPYAQQLTEIGITPEERAAEMLDTDAQAIKDALKPLEKSIPEQPTSEFDFTANDVIQGLIRTPEGQQVARQLLRNINPKLLRIQQFLNSLDPNDTKYEDNVNAILSRISRQDLEALNRQNELIQSVIGQQT